MYADHVDSNPALARLFARIPAHIRATFSGDQIEALGRAALNEHSNHALAMRRTVPLLGGRYYLAVFVGRDRRRKLSSIERFILRGMKDSWSRRTFATLGLIVLAGIIVLGSICVTYLLKTALGINLLDGPSILHNLLYWR
jgi:hypothetical protein